MSGCDAFATRLEAHLNGQLPPEQEVELAAHLPGCLDCRSFADAVRRAERALTTPEASDLLSPAERVHRQVQRDLPRSRWISRLGLLGGGLSLGIITWIGFQEGWDASFAGLEALLVGCFVWTARSTERTLRSYAALSPDELLKRELAAHEAQERALPRHERAYKVGGAVIIAVSAALVAATGVTGFAAMGLVGLGLWAKVPLTRKARELGRAKARKLGIPLV